MRRRGLLPRRSFAPVRRGLAYLVGNRAARMTLAGSRPESRSKVPWALSAGYLGDEDTSRTGTSVSHTSERCQLPCAGLPYLAGYQDNNLFVIWMPAKHGNSSAHSIGNTANDCAMCKWHSRLL